MTTRLREHATPSGLAPAGRPSSASVLVAGALVGSTILVPRIGPNLVVLEPLLAFVAVSGLLWLARHRPPWLQRLISRSFPWVLVIAFATAGSLLHAGFTSWALTNIAQSAYAFVLFYGALGFFGWHRRETRTFVLALAATAVLVVIALVLVDDPRQRAPGLFYHSNYAAHFLAGAWLLIVLTFRQRASRIVATVLFAVGISLTASFGALLMVVAAGGYGIARRLVSKPAIALVALVVLGAAWYASYEPDLLAVEDVAVTDTLSSQRLERSSSGRFELWTDAVSVLGDAPMGVGPDGLRRTGVLESGKEAHNTYVAYLAERGPVGLLGLLGFGLALWRVARAGGVARPLLVAFATGNLVRETLHYRHMWLILALAFVVDEVSAERAAADAT